MRRKSKSYYKSISLTAALCLFAGSVLSGCGSGDNSSGNGTDGNKGGNTADTANAPFSYPIDTDTVLTCFSVNPLATKTHERYEDTEFAKYVTEQTGVKVTYTFGNTEQFNVMIASGDYPDLLEYNFCNYPGGPERAIKDGVIISLNGLQEETPNLNRLLADHPFWDKQVKTDNGTYYIFPFFRGDPRLQTYRGPIIRQDWLDDLGLETPETVDEMEHVLREFKDKKGAEAPLCVTDITFLSVLMAGAYELMGPDFQLDANGEIIYGAYTDNYRQMLLKLNDWYNKGLLDPSYGAVDRAALDANILNGTSGVTVQNAGGGFGRWMDAKTDEPDYQLGGVKPLVLKKGDRPYGGQVDNVFSGTNSMAISGACKNPELAARHLDYGYSDEGYMTYNFGEEGVAYNMIDGYPTYTDLLMHNPDGLSVAETMYIYIRGNTGSQFVQDWRYMEQYTQRDSQKEALTMWSETDAIDHIVPQLYFTEEEAAQIAKYKADVDTLVNEKTTKFIVGAEDMANFDAFQEELKSLGIEKMLEIYKAAYTRYQGR